MTARPSPRSRRTAVAGLLATLILTACGAAPERDAGEEDAAQGGSATTAASAQDLGGMEGLVAAAKKEGALNVIALPPDWTNYGEIIKTFGEKYGITVNSAQPDGTSQDEINAANQLRATDRAPDVFDLGLSVALANEQMFAPYKVQTWEDIPEDLKHPAGRWFSDYGGVMSIGYDAKAVPAPTSVTDLLEPAYKGKVALNGDPTQAAAGFNGVAMAALANGGSPDDIAPGVEFFRKLKEAGNLIPVDPTPATIASGQTPVVVDWDYTNAAQADAQKGKRDWKVVVPEGAAVSSYYVQAINKDAPHPAAARLWEEFLYSDEGQNLWLKGYGRPVRAEAMQQAGTIDQAAFAKLPKAAGAVSLTQEQSDKAKEYLGANWAKAVG
ncbi:MAG: extracellular solute-binding protein [Actinomycetota bacterium]|nr:extracellular solute-binding protein [Actinomycetota bacterium]